MKRRQREQKQTEAHPHTQAELMEELRRRSFTLNVITARPNSAHTCSSLDHLFFIRFCHVEFLLVLRIFQ